MKQWIGRSFYLALFIVSPYLDAGSITIIPINGTPYSYTTNNNKITITGYFGNSGALNIPSTILVNGVNLPVISIGAGTFEGTGLTSVTIPDGVISIGSEAFQNCHSLTDITIPNSVTSIGDEAFKSCYNLKSVTIPISVVSIGANAFAYCSSLMSVAIPVSVTSIGDGAFTGCYNLKTISIPISVTSIGSNTFEYCSGLMGVTIPISVTSIGGDAFHWCSSLTSVTIPNSVNSIGIEAFESCVNLKSVIISNNVTNIGSNTFTGCAGLTSLTIPSSIGSLGINAFSACANLISIYFTGNAPNADQTTFAYDHNTTAYYLPGTTGWASTFAGIPAILYLSQPIITTSPMSSAVVTGSSVSFSLAVNSTLTPSYQWQVSKDGGNTWSNINDTTYSGTSTATLTVINSITSQLGYQYQAVVLNSAGTTTTIPVTLIVGTSSSHLNWLQSYFSPQQLGNPAIVGGYSTPANDGIPNLIKYALNLNPLIDGHSYLPQPTVINGNLTLSFQALQPDIIYAIQASRDLVNWDTSGVTQINDTTNGTVSASDLLP